MGLKQFGVAGDWNLTGRNKTDPSESVIGEMCCGPLDMLNVGYMKPQTLCSSDSKDRIYAVSGNVPLKRKICSLRFPGVRINVAEKPKG